MSNTPYHCLLVLTCTSSVLAAAELDTLTFFLISTALLYRATSSFGVIILHRYLQLVSVLLGKDSATLAHGITFPAKELHSMHDQGGTAM